MSENILTATHAGELNLAGIVIPCYVTIGEIRLLSGRGMQEALRLVDSQLPESGQKPGSRLARLLGNKSLNPLFLKDKSADHFSPIKCSYRGKPIHGYRCDVLADICDAMLSARTQGLLKTKRQEIVAAQCEVLIRAFARVGIAALIDEATGYQRDRAKDALAKILEDFIAKELRPWVKTFQDDYYEQMFRLKGWSYVPEVSQKKPQVVGKYTNNIVYDRLAPFVLSELKKVTPKNSKGQYKARLHQSLTENIGYQKLKEHLVAVVTLMRASQNWSKFMSLLNRALPKYNETLPIPFPEDQDTEN